MRLYDRVFFEVLNMGCGYGSELTFFAFSPRGIPLCEIRVFLVVLRSEAWNA